MRYAAVTYTLTPESSANPPVYLEDARQWLKEPPAEDNALIDALIRGACERIEEETGLALSSRAFTYEATADRALVATRMQLPRKPVTAVASVTVVDAEGEETTLVVDEDYYVRLSTGTITFPGGLALAAGSVVVVEFTAGYASASGVPQTVKDAITLAVADRYEHRNTVVVGQAVSALPNGVRALLIDSGYARVTV